MKNEAQIQVPIWTFAAIWAIFYCINRAKKKTKMYKTNQYDLTTQSRVRIYE